LPPLSFISSRKAIIMKFTAAVVLSLTGTVGAFNAVHSFVVDTTNGAIVNSRRRARQEFTLTQPFLSLRKQSKLRMVDYDDDDEDYDDNEEEGPLADGIESVSWLPTVVNAKDIDNPKISRDDSEFLPLFPLGGIVYTPNSEHVLNIFEPRYRQMYTDILMNGTKRFVVSMSHPTETGRFAQMGVLFELEDVKEVSEMTADQIKYICNHKVTGRVKLHRILNPSAWSSRETYLRVEGTIIDDSGKDNAATEDDEDEEALDESEDDVYAAVAAAATPKYTKEEREVRNAFSDLVDLQHDMEEDVRFTRAAVGTLALKKGAGEDGLWQTIKLWQSFVDQRLMARQNELQRDFQERLQEFLKKEKGVKEDEMPSAIGFQDLSADLQEEVKALQKRMGVELKPLVLESTLTMQKILEAENHHERLNLLKYFIEAETKRLTTKKTLQGMFSGSATSSDASMPAEERMEEPKAEKPKKKSDKKKTEEEEKPPSSIFFDEDDAFQ